MANVLHSNAYAVSFDPVFEESGVVYECAVWELEPIPGERRHERTIVDIYTSTSILWLVEIARLNFGGPEQEQLPDRCSWTFDKLFHAAIDIDLNAASDAPYLVSVWQHDAITGLSPRQSADMFWDKKQLIMRDHVISLLEALDHIDRSVDQALMKYRHGK